MQILSSVLVVRSEEDGPGLRYFGKPKCRYCQVHTKVGGLAQLIQFPSHRFTEDRIPNMSTSPELSHQQ